MRMIIAFEKTERVRHLGHLDLMRAMQRALRRSGLPIRYSQGFNPHVVLSFASPLPVGASGCMELMDVALDAEMEEAVFLAAFAKAVPPSLPVSAVRAVDERHPKLMAQLTSAAWETRMEPSAAARQMTDAIPALLARETIDAIRKSKRGETPCDIRPMLYALSSREEADAVVITMQTALTEAATLKPDLLLSALAKQAGLETPPPSRLRRLGLFGTKDGAQAPHFNYVGDAILGHKGRIPFQLAPKFKP